MATAITSRSGHVGKLALHRTIASFRDWRRAVGLSRPDTTIGLVPTMGALHEGHLALVRQARRDNDVVVASIFVNPAQFGPHEDLERYPRQLAQDSRVLADLGVDHVLAPDADMVYGQHHTTYIDPQGFDQTAEGQSRPGHFRGVATIVTKLFNIVQPTNAYFGQKDAAQCVLIRRVTEDLNLDVTVHVLDTVRDADGLALSSRNAYLTESERRAAPVVYQALTNARSLFQQLENDDDDGGRENPCIDRDALVHVVRATLAAEPLVSEIQYVAVDCKATLQPLEHVHLKQGAVLSLACKIGNVRLIDNIIL
jgi:pantoate--beta-alanine ligase